MEVLKNQRCEVLCVHAAAKGKWAEIIVCDKPECRGWVRLKYLHPIPEADHPDNKGDKCKKDDTEKEANPRKGSQVDNLMQWIEYYRGTIENMQAKEEEV